MRLPISPLSYLLLASILAPAIASADDLPPGDHHLSVASGASTRPYFLHIPQNSPGPLPLVIMLHGAGGMAEHAARDYGWIDKSDAEHFIAVFPQGLPVFPARPESFLTNPNIWNDHRNVEMDNARGIDDVAYITSVLDDVEKNCSLDKNRIYISGFSNGASMTFYLATQLSSRIAAIAPVSGHNFAKDAKLDHPIPLMLIVGDADPLNPINGGPGKNPWGNAPTTKPAMANSITDWLAFDHIPPDDVTTETKDNITTKTYGTKTGCPIIYTIIADQGHEWPGHRRVLPKTMTGNNTATFDATAAIWDFFKTKSLKN